MGTAQRWSWVWLIVGAAPVLMLSLTRIEATAAHLPDWLFWSVLGLAVAIAVLIALGDARQPMTCLIALPLALAAAWVAEGALLDVLAFPALLNPGQVQRLFFVVAGIVGWLIFVALTGLAAIRLRGSARWPLALGLSGVMILAPLASITIDALLRTNTTREALTLALGLSHLFGLFVIWYALGSLGAVWLATTVASRIGYRRRVVSDA